MSIICHHKISFCGISAIDKFVVIWIFDKTKPEKGFFINSVWTIDYRIDHISGDMWCGVLTDNFFVLVQYFIRNTKMVFAFTEICPYFMVKTFGRQRLK